MSTSPTKPSCTTGSTNCRASSSPSESYKLAAVTASIQHGEGPHWDSQTGVLYYVDTFKATIYRWDPKTNLVTNQVLEGRNSVGTITPIRENRNKFIVSADRYIYLLEWDGLQNNTGKLSELLEIEEHKPRNQFNDGKADVNGHLWVGTLTRKPDLGVSPNGGSLYRFTSCQNLGYKEKRTNVSISNGMAWSKNNKHMFYIDSTEKTVEKWNFGPNTGSLTEKKILFDLTKYPEIEGIPDGMTIDSNDNLYVAIFGGYSVLKIDSNSGKILNCIKLPAKYPTSAAFGGPNLDILYVTTSTVKRDDIDLKETPQAGAVFAITGLSSKGLPMYEFVL